MQSPRICSMLLPETPFIISMPGENVLTKEFHNLDLIIFSYQIGAAKECLVPTAHCLVGKLSSKGVVLWLI